MQQKWNSQINLRVKIWVCLRWFKKRWFFSMIFNVFYTKTKNLQTIDKDDYGSLYKWNIENVPINIKFEMPKIIADAAWKYKRKVDADQMLNTNLYYSRICSKRYLFVSNWWIYTWINCNFAPVDRYYASRDRMIENGEISNKLGVEIISKDAGLIFYQMSKLG